ncbi:MAG: hypothetical protein JWM16_3465 [Verrucomicrobiales bacterium]|nr:hypothetical protein [Verrucomicrobiales bacterium]
MDGRMINEHIQNVFEVEKLSRESVIRKFQITAADGKSYDTQHYNLEVVNCGAKGDTERKYDRYRTLSNALRGFSWKKWTNGKPSERLALIPAGQEQIL